MKMLGVGGLANNSSSQSFSYQMTIFQVEFPFNTGSQLTVSIPTLAQSGSALAENIKIGLMLNLIVNFLA